MRGPMGNIRRDEKAWASCGEKDDDPSTWYFLFLPHYTMSYDRTFLVMLVSIEIPSQSTPRQHKPLEFNSCKKPTLRRMKLTNVQWHLYSGYNWHNVVWLTLLRVMRSLLSMILFVVRQKLEIIHPNERLENTAFIFTFNNGGWNLITCMCVDRMYLCVCVRACVCNVYNISVSCVLWEYLTCKYHSCLICIVYVSSVA